jgi:hypothetical protein
LCNYNRCWGAHAHVYKCADFQIVTKSCKTYKFKYMTGKKTICKYFLSAAGCQYGDKCRYAHTSNPPTTRNISPTPSAGVNTIPSAHINETPSAGGNATPSTGVNATLSVTNNSTVEELDIPADFICPISREAMEYPYITAQGNSYEYGEIKRWLKNNNTDPKSGVILESKVLISNNILRSQIIEWFETHNQHRTTSAEKPPNNLSTEDSTELSKILNYKGSKRVEKKKKDILFSPKYFPDYGENTYFFSKPSSESNSCEFKKGIQVSCDGGESIEAPETSIFLTSKGVVFFDPTEIRDTKVIPGIDDSKVPCKYRNGCKNENCKKLHAFVCSLGVKCPSISDGSTFCKFYHPDANSVVPLGDTYPLNVACKYNSECSSKKCGFAHPLGRFSQKREAAKVLVTHTHKLEKLEVPIPLQLDIPDAANSFQFQGEFVFFFVPFPGTWALKHYQKVIVHHFDAEKQVYKLIGEYSLDGHYCNCVAGAGNYFIISFWPYEEEAVRTVWDCLKVARSMEKVFRNKEKLWKKEIQNKDQEIEQLNEKITELQSKFATVKIKLLKAQKKIIQNQKLEQMRRIQAEQRREARELEARWKREQFLQEEKLRKEKLRKERDRNERLRMRDPIHIYQLSSGTGSQKSDWTLVVDYHKGAHNIKLDFHRKSESHSLEITENENIFFFELLCPNLESISNLPLIPEVLCPGF